MRHPLYSLLAAIGLFVLGSASLAPFTPTKTIIAPDGTVSQRSETERRLAELRVNWFAYLCFAGAAVSFGWTGYLVSAGVVSMIRTKHRDSTR